MEDTTVVKKPPKKAVKSIQYDLFSSFITNEEQNISNTVDIWESIPKYFFTHRQVEKLRTSTGHADPYKWEYTNQEGSACKIKIQPALIEQKDGAYKAFFPSITEELVEEALKKIFTDQKYACFDSKETESWVRFTLKMIHKELKKRGRTRSIPEIKHAIEVMSSCILTFHFNGKEMWKGSILQDLVTVGREEYQADTNAHHIARLPLFISHAINSLEYRQFNYQRLMQCNEQLSRWIYKRLINRYRQANSMNSYHFMYSELKASGLLQQSRERDNRQKVISALKELIKEKVIMNYETDERKEGRKIVDVKYTVRSTPEFIKDQKASNKRKRDSELHILHSGEEIRRPLLN
jgi:hypothetical protein